MGQSDKYYGNYPARNILRNIRTRAAKQEVPFNLTEEWYNEHFVRGCAVTGMAFAQHRSRSPWVPHVDRLDPEKGYIIENCRLVCAIYNQAKGQWTDTDVREMMLHYLQRLLEV